LGGGLWLLVSTPLRIGALRLLCGGRPEAESYLEVCLFEMMSEESGCAY